MCSSGVERAAGRLAVRGGSVSRVPETVYVHIESLGGRIEYPFKSGIERRKGAAGVGGPGGGCHSEGRKAGITKNGERVRRRQKNKERGLT